MSGGLAGCLALKWDGAGEEWRESTCQVASRWRRAPGTGVPAISVMGRGLATLHTRISSRDARVEVSAALVPSGTCGFYGIRVMVYA